MRFTAQYTVNITGRKLNISFDLPEDTIIPKLSLSSSGDKITRSDSFSFRITGEHLYLIHNSFGLGDKAMDPVLRKMNNIKVNGKELDLESEANSHKALKAAIEREISVTPSTHKINSQTDDEESLDKRPAEAAREDYSAEDIVKSLYNSTGFTGNIIISKSKKGDGFEDVTVTCEKDIEDLTIREKSDPQTPTRMTTGDSIITQMKLAGFTKKQCTTALTTALDGMNLHITFREGGYLTPIFNRKGSWSSSKITFDSETNELTINRAWGNVSYPFTERTYGGASGEAPAGGAVRG